MSIQSAPVISAIPDKPLTAIQIVEQEIAGFIQQREQALSQVQAVSGALQGAQHLLARLKQEVARAEAEAQKLLTEALADTKHVVGEFHDNVIELAKKLEGN